MRICPDNVETLIRALHACVVCRDHNVQNMHTITININCTENDINL